MAMSDQPYRDEGRAEAPRRRKAGVVRRPAGNWVPPLRLMLWLVLSVWSLAGWASMSWLAWTISGSVLVAAVGWVWGQGGFERKRLPPGEGGEK